MKVFKDNRLLKIRKNLQSTYKLLLPATLLNVTLLHVCFHVFQIVQMVSNRVKHHIISA